MTGLPISDSSEQDNEVNPLELFFDLVFVLGLLQLSRHLRANLTWRGTAEMLVMLLPILAVWAYTSWAATLIPADKPRTRRMLLMVMVLGLFMNAAVTRAFTDSGWAFVLPLLLIQLGRTFWTFVNSPNEVYRDQFFRILIWMAATTPLWIVGAAMDSETRLIWWALAAGIDLIGTWLAQPLPGWRLRSEGVYFEGSHMLERCQLFLLIALGETVLDIGFAIAGQPTILMTGITGMVALAGTIALWSLAFGRAGRLALWHVEITEDPVHVSRHVVNVLMVMVAGLIALAVANDEVIDHPFENTYPLLNVLLYGGPILFLLAQSWYFWYILQIRPRLHLIGSAALFGIGFATLALPPYVALILVGVSLSTLALLDRQ